MSNKKILLPIIVAFSFQLSTFAQTSNYSGTWVLNNEKSNIQTRPDGMTSSIFIIKQNGNDFSLTIHHVFGNQQDTIVIEMLSDGKTRKRSKCVTREAGMGKRWIAYNTLEERFFG